MVLAVCGTSGSGRLNFFTSSPRGLDCTGNTVLEVVDEDEKQNGAQ